MTRAMMRRAAMAAVATLGIAIAASCGKEEEKPSPLPTLPTIETLVGTEWEGSYDSDVEYRGMPVTMRLVWTMDFLTDSTGTLLVEVSSSFSQTEYDDFAFGYSYDGVSEGLLATGGEEEPFAVDPIGQTVTIDLQMPVGLGDGGNQVVLGGRTTLHRVR